MPYAVVRLTPPVGDQHGDRYVVEWPYEPRTFPVNQYVSTGPERVELLDGPYDERGEAEDRLLRRVGAIKGRPFEQSTHRFDVT